jgi:hypothetical protein
LPPFRADTLAPRTAAIARALGFCNARALQRLVICELAGVGGRVSPHHDSVFNNTAPPSAVGFWYALETARAGNGGLSFARGSHLRTSVRRRFCVETRGGGGSVDGNYHTNGVGIGRRQSGSGDAKESQRRKFVVVAVRTREKGQRRWREKRGKRTKRS